MIFASRERGMVSEISCAPNGTFPQNVNFARGRNSTQHNNNYLVRIQTVNLWVGSRLLCFFVSAMTLPTDVLCDMVYREARQSTPYGFGIDHIAQNIRRKRHGAHQKTQKPGVHPEVNCLYSDQIMCCVLFLPRAKFSFFGNVAFGAHDI